MLININIFCQLEAFLQISGGQMRPLPNSIRILFIIWFMECCHLFKGHLSYLSNVSTESFRISAAPNAGILLGLHGRAGKSPEVIHCFRSELLPTVIEKHGFTPIRNLLRRQL